MQSTHCILMTFLTRYFLHFILYQTLKETHKSFVKLENVDFQENLREVESNRTNKHSNKHSAVEADFIEGANHAHSYKEYIDELIADALINGIAAWYVLELMKTILHSFMLFVAHPLLLASAEIYKLDLQAIEAQSGISF